MTSRAYSVAQRLIKMSNLLANVGMPPDIIVESLMETIGKLDDDIRDDVYRMITDYARATIAEATEPMTVN